MLVDSHCHIHEADYAFSYEETRARAAEAGVTMMLCVGTSEESSRQAIAFARQYAECRAIIGVHPHDTKDGYADIAAMVAAHRDLVVGIGEIGLDYFYTHSPRDVQIAAFEAQLRIAHEAGLPVSFHVREAFDDFWPIVEKFPGVRGVLHSFTDTAEQLQKVLAAGFYVGLNGISTFTKDEAQQQMYDAVPLERIIFETDAPFLTPVPFRGKVNEPAYIRAIAEYHAKRRGISVEEIADITTRNVRELFTLSYTHTT